MTSTRRAQRCVSGPGGAFTPSALVSWALGFDQLIVANLLASYTFPIGSNELAISANYRYTSSMFYTFTQTNTRDESTDNSFLNARAAFAFGQNLQYNVALWGNNLTEEFADMASSLLPIGGMSRRVSARPTAR